MTDFFNWFAGTEYWHILSDPSHLGAEVTFTFMVDVVFFGLMIPFFNKLINRKIRREHKRIDAEHGVEHNA